MYNELITAHVLTIDILKHVSDKGGNERCGEWKGKRRVYGYLLRLKQICAHL
jgi:hypothetical protein